MRVFPIVFLLSFVASIAFAQQATVQGVVADASGASVPSAKGSMLTFPTPVPRPALYRARFK